MPVLETERLHLRELTLNDAPALFEVLGDAETMRWFPSPLTPSEVEVWIERQRGRYPGGTGLHAVVLKETGEMIGDCGAVWQEVEGVREIEIGYHLNRYHWNRGYATEAVREVLRYVFGPLACNHAISLIRPENGASRRVAEKNGFVFDRIVHWRDYDHCIYRAPRAAGRVRSVEEQNRAAASELLNTAMSYARLVLRRYGEIAPFAFSIKADGSVSRETLDHPRLPAEPASLWRLLHDHLTRRAQRGEIQAAAAAANIALDQSSQEGYSDAIVLQIETRGGYAVKVTVPYRMYGGQLWRFLPRRVAQGEPTMVEIAGTIIPSEPQPASLR
jgi:RimJ/RimL family protein N-acetyltransferase